MVDGTELVVKTADGYKERLAVVSRRIDAYDCEYGRRWCTDEYNDTMRCLSNVAKWLSGEFDGSYAGPWGPYSTVHGFRVYYANGALRDSLHHLVWAEYYAGLHDREWVKVNDPFQQTKAVS